MSEGFAGQGAGSPGRGGEQGSARTLAELVPPYPADGPAYSGDGPADPADGPPYPADGPADAADGPPYPGDGPADAADGPPYPGDGPADAADGPPYPGDGPADAADGPPYPEDGPPYPADGPAGQADRRIGGRRLTALVVGTALTAALAGGLAGGYIQSRASSAGTSPGFSLGSVPPAVTDRPPNSVAGIAARVLPSVVMIKVNGAQGTGSGFVIKGGYIVTDNHVITLDGQVRHATLEVVFDGGRAVPAKVIGADPYSDIAVIKPQAGVGLPALTLGNSSSVRVGDPVIAFGSPLGLAGTVTSGIVSALSRPVQPSTSANVTGAPQVFFEAIQTDAPINPGNSGGPLVNGQAQVIGISSAIDTLGGNPLTGSQGGSIGLGFAIPINQARLVATQLIRTGRAAHAVIGALLDQSYTGSGAQIAGSRQGRQAAVSPGGPASRAGLRPGDVITGFGGQRIGNATALLDAIRSLAPGARVKITFSRNGQQHTASLTLGSAES